MLGVPVIVARSWFVIAAIVTFLFAPSVPGAVGVTGPLAYLVAFAYALLLFASVLVHEISHAAAARTIGMPATHVVIDLWGGHTQFDSEASSPGRSFYVAVVGPLSNALVATLAWLFLVALSPSGVTRLLVGALAVTNGFVAAFNLVPGLPLDGGRLLESLVWKVTGERSTGTLVAGWGGRVVAVTLVGWALGWPLLSGGQPRLVTVAWSALIGAFLWHGASQAIAVAHIRRRTPGVSVGGLATRAVAVPEQLSVAQALAAARSAGTQDVVLVDADGRPTGLLDPVAAQSVPPERAGEASSLSVARAMDGSAVVRSDVGGEALLRLLTDAPAHAYAVLDPAGRVVGVLRGDDVVAAVTTRR